MNKLDRLQEEVVNAPIESNLLVLAGPGTGKTTISVERLAKFDELLDLETGDEVLYVSFSNASIESSFQGRQAFLEALSYFISTKTLDAFALEVIRWSDGFDVDGQDPDFEERLIYASNLIASGEFEGLSSIKHLIVDEAQDIYGARQEFLFELIKALPNNCGITMFADPMQSIYSFQQASADSKSGLTLWQEFSKILQELRSFEVVSLSQHYRPRNSKMKRFFNDLNLARDLAVNGLDFSEQLISLRFDLVEWNFDDVSEIIQHQRYESTAILCRTNSECIQVFQQLQDKGIRSSIEFATSKMSESGVSDPDFEVQEHHQDAPNVLRQSSTFGVQVMTIHQSKGKEFEWVGLVNADRMIKAGDWELFYVAMSRASRIVADLDCALQPSVKLGFPPRRALKNSWERRPNAIQVRPTDVDLRSSFYWHTRGGPKFGLLKFQLNEWSHSFPIFDISVDDEIIGRTNKEFGDFFKKQFGPSYKDWPSLGSVPTDGYTIHQSNLINDCETMSLSPRPLGFATLVWSSE